MMKRLALICCILLLPTFAAAASSSDGNTHYGEFWVGGQLGAVFTLDPGVTLSVPNLFPGQQFTGSVKIDPGFSAGAIAGYNFCMPHRQVWERYFGVAVDFQWNQFNPEDLNGNQYALSFLARVQYPLMGSERFTFGRITPFLMAGPSIVWTEVDFSNFGGGSKTETNIGIIAELGVEFFIVPHMSIGPSFRYRHVFGPTFQSGGVRLDTELDQFMVLGRLAYHF
jgi:opacity protein-like surface antigen